MGALDSERWEYPQINYYRNERSDFVLLKLSSLYFLSLYSTSLDLLATTSSIDQIRTCCLTGLSVYVQLRIDNKLLRNKLNRDRRLRASDMFGMHVPRYIDSCMGTYMVRSLLSKSLCFFCEKEAALGQKGSEV